MKNFRTPQQLRLAQSAAGSKEIATKGYDPYNTVHAIGRVYERRCADAARRAVEKVSRSEYDANSVLTAMIRQAREQSA